MAIQWLCNTLLALLILTTQSCLASQNSPKKSLDNSRPQLNSFAKLDIPNPSPSAQKEEKEEFYDEHSNQPHSRKKRLIWVTDDGRLALPPGTTLTISPTIAMPLVRHPPEGFFSNISISMPVTIDFDKLGLTDNQNPLGDLPPIFARSFGHGAGSMLADYVANYINYRAKRDTAESEAPKRNNQFVKFNHIIPKLPERFQHVFHGGERVMLYGVAEDFLGTFGLNGKACVLRTICEMHSRSVGHFGVFGEMAKLFFAAKESPFADLMPDYVKAQEVGEGKIAPGECFPYYKDCPKSIFKAMQDQNNKYSETPSHSEYHEAADDELLVETHSEDHLINTNSISM